MKNLDLAVLILAAAVVPATLDSVWKRRRRWLAWLGGLHAGTKVWMKGTPS